MMRLQLNLNKYYDGLNITQTNAIFSKFMDMKIEVEQLKFTLSKPYEKRGQLWLATKDVYSKAVFDRARDINIYMMSINKEEVFIIGSTIEDTDFEDLISKYEYLISETDLDL